MKRQPTEAEKALTLRIIAIWPIVIGFGLLFIVLKLVIYPKQLDWGVLVSGCLLVFVGFQLRQARGKLQAAWADHEN